MILLLLGRSISEAALALHGELFALVPRSALGSLSSAHPKSRRRALIFQGQKAGERLNYPSARGRSVRHTAESQGHGWSEVTSLGSAARRLPLVSVLLEEEVELTSVFQAGSQTGIILMFPAENRCFLAKLKFSM